MGEFIDDGWSGGSLERPALARLREAVAQELVDVVLTYDPDRLARDLADLLFLDKEFQRAGVRLETVTTEIDSSPEGRMFFQFKGAFAEYERAIIRRRTIEGRRRKAKEGKLVNPRTLPRWLRYDAQTSTVMLDEEWAQVISLAYRLVDEEGLNLRALARRFHELGIPTPQGGTHWRASTLREWLRSTAARGDYYQLRYEHVEAKRPLKALPQRRKSSYRLRPREEWQLVRVPAAVAPDLWERVQRRLGQNKALAARNTRREYLLQGLVRCGLCGRRMTGRYHTRDKHRFYRCKRSRELEHDIHGEACPQKLVRADRLEEVVWEAIEGLLQEPETLRKELKRRCEEGSPTREVSEQEFLAARKRLEAIPREQDRLVEGYGKGLIPDDRMRQRMEALKAEEDMLQRRVAELERQLTRLEVTQEQESQALAFAQRVRDGLDHLDFAGRQQLLRLVLEDVTCYDSRAVIRTIIPTGASDETGQLCPPHREGATGVRSPACGVATSS